MDEQTMNSDDEFDEEALRLAALKSLKQPKYVNQHNLIPIVPINVVSPIVNSNIKLEPISPTREQKFLEEKVRKEPERKESSSEEETEEEVEVEAEGSGAPDAEEDEEDLERLMDKLEAEIEGKVVPQKTTKVKIKKKRKKKKLVEEEEVELVDVRIGKTKPVGPVIDVRESLTPEPQPAVRLRHNTSRSSSRRRSPGRWTRSRSPGPVRPRRWSRSRTPSVGPRRRRTRSRSWSPSPYKSRSPIPRYRSRSRYRSPPRRWSKSPRRLVRSPIKTRLSPYRPRSRSRSPRRLSPTRLRSRSPPPRPRSPRRWSRSPRPRSRTPPPRSRLRSRSPPPPRPKSPAIRSPKRLLRSRSPRSPLPPLRSARSPPAPARPKRRTSLSPPRGAKQNAPTRRRSQSPAHKRRPTNKERRSPHRRKNSPKRNGERKKEDSKVEKSTKKVEEEVEKESSGPVDPVLEARRLKFQSVPDPSADKKISLKAVKETIEPLEDEGVELSLDAGPSLWDDDDEDESDSQEGRFKSGNASQMKPITLRGLRDNQPVRIPSSLDELQPRFGANRDRSRRDRPDRRRRDDRSRRNDRRRQHDRSPVKDSVKNHVTRSEKTPQSREPTKDNADDFDEFVSAFEKELEKVPEPEPAPAAALASRHQSPKPRIFVKKDLFAESSLSDKVEPSKKVNRVREPLSVSSLVTETADSSDLRSLLARRRQERIGAPLQPIKSRLVQSAFQGLIQPQEASEKRRGARIVLKMKADDESNNVNPFAGRIDRDLAPRPKRRVRKVEGATADDSDPNELDALVTRKARGFRLKRSVTIASQVNSDD